MAVRFSPLNLEIVPRQQLGVFEMFCRQWGVKSSHREKEFLEKNWPKDSTKEKREKWIKVGFLERRVEM